MLKRNTVFYGNQLCIVLQNQREACVRIVSASINRIVFSAVSAKLGASACRNLYRAGVIGNTEGAPLGVQNRCAIKRSIYARLASGNIKDILRGSQRCVQQIHIDYKGLASVVEYISERSGNGCQRGIRNCHIRGIDCISANLDVRAACNAQVAAVHHEACLRTVSRCVNLYIVKIQGEETSGIAPEDRSAFARIIFDVYGAVLQRHRRLRRQIRCDKVTRAVASRIAYGRECTIFICQSTVASNIAVGFGSAVRQHNVAVLNGDFAAVCTETPLRIIGLSVSVNNQLFAGSNHNRAVQIFGGFGRGYLLADMDCINQRNGCLIACAERSNQGIGLILGVSGVSRREEFVVACKIGVRLSDTADISLRFCECIVIRFHGGSRQDTQDRGHEHCKD